MKPNNADLAERPNTLRRKLFRGAYGGVGVLMAVQAKTALGGGLCQSPSAQMSGNTSPRPGTGTTCSGGRSPGFWKVPQKFSYWSSTGATPPTFKLGVNVDYCSSGMQGLSMSDVENQGTLLTAVGFSGAPANTGLWAVLAFPNSFTGGQLLRHLAAAWLNAGYFSSDAAKYPLTKQQVIDMWNATKSGGLYCPSGMSCGVNQGWDANKVIDYIKVMYDINSGVDDPELCKRS